jgi:hypothetical protein
MQNQIPNRPYYPVAASRCESTSNILFALGVVLLVCGGALGGHHWNMVGLGLIIFSSLYEL